MARASDKSDTWSTASKFSAGYSTFSAGFSSKNREYVSGYAGWQGRHIQLILGDFNARYGQGLISWTGFTMNTLYTVGAFARSPGGVSASNTLSEGSAKRGLAVDIARSSADLSLYATIGGEQLAHFQYLTKRGSYGLTALHTPDSWSVSADWRLTLGKFTAFGEATPKAVRTGVFYNHSYGKRGAVLLRGS